MFFLYFPVTAHPIWNFNFKCKSFSRNPNLLYKEVPVVPTPSKERHVKKHYYYYQPFRDHNDCT